MARHNDTGKKGEELAAAYFSGSGYKIMHRNWRHKHWEVDIIASRGAVLHFIEVKTRASDRLGYPEENVDDKKIRYLMNAAEEYLYQHPEWQRIQFDILSIVINENETTYFLIEDVYL